MIEADASRYAPTRARRPRSLQDVRYGVTHRRLRRQYAPLVASGLAVCARCRKLIEPGTPWDLGHVEGSNTEYSGPEHRLCNRGAPGRNVTSRVW